MKDITYRNIFPNNNIPKVKVEIKEPSLEEKLSIAVNSLVNWADFSKISYIAKEIEFKDQVKLNPSIALLKKLREICIDTDEASTDKISELKENISNK